MDYYRELLDTIFTTLSGETPPRVLALTFRSEYSNAENRCKGSGVFELPVGFLPSNSEHRILSDGEPFVQEALREVNTGGFKCLFVFPPLLGYMRLSESFRDHHKGLGLEEATANALLTNLTLPPKTVAFLVNSPFIGTTRFGKWRKDFFPAHSAVVIEHDHNLSHHLHLPVHTNFRFSTIIFTNTPGAVRFFKISEEAIKGGTARILSDIKRLLQQPVGKTQFGYVYGGSLDESYPTRFDYYTGEIERRREEIRELGEPVPLEQVADVLEIGFLPLSPGTDDGKGKSNFLAINAPDVTTDGRVDLSNAKTITMPSILKHFLQKGDFCIRTFYPSGSGFVVGIFEEEGHSITWDAGVIVVRPHSSLLPSQRQVLLSFLRSSLAQRLGSAKQKISSLGNQFRLTAQTLKQFPVPIADKEIIVALQNLNEAREAFQRWISDIDDASNAIFEESTAYGSKSRILESGHLARQRFRAGNQVEDLDYRIRTQFPHPLAYLWQEVQVTGTDPYHRLSAITRAAEGHTCFLAQIGILLGKLSGKTIGYTEIMANRFSTRQGGTNFGDWFAIVKELNEARSIQSLGSTIPFVELRRLCSEGTWETAVRFLMDVRNDDSHGRISPRGVASELLEKAEKSLEALYRETEFLTDYRLLMITETKFDSIKGVMKFKFRDLSGDTVHPPFHTGETKRTDLETGSLYLRDRQGDIHLLRPLLQYLECPECHQMSTFFLDTYDGSGGNIVGIKSFERNSVRREPIADDFRHVGLLK